MAKKIVYNIEIDSTDAQGSIKRVEERLNELNQTANASQKEINTLQQELKDLGQTRSDTAIEGIQSLRREYRRLTEELQRTEEGTEKFNELAQAAGQVRDRIDAANDSISNFNNSPFENIKSNLGQLAQKIRDLDFDGFKQSARDLGTNFANLGRSLIGLDKGLSVSAIGFRTLGVAIAATGVGALIAGISILIRNFDTLKSSGGLLGNSIKFLGELFTSFETSVLKLSDALGITANAYENFKKKQNEANQTTVKSAKEIEEEVQRLRKETYNAGLSDLEKALVAEREFRQKQFAVFIQDFRNQQARTAQERKELDEKAFIATEEFQKESERRLQKIRDDFAKEENKKAAEAAKKREQERIDALSKGFEDEKRLREKQFRNQQLIIGNLEYNAQIKLSEGLREARLNGVDIRQALSQILDQEFLDKQENVRLLYQTEYQYYSDLFDIKDKLEQQIIAEEKRLTKAPEQFDTLGFVGERPEYLVDLRNNLLTVQEDINKASSESVVRFVSLYSDRFNELVQTFQEPNLWQNIFVGYQDETEARFQATETTARQYIEKLKSILSGGEKGLFAEGLGTESEARKLIAGELAAAERVLADVQTKRLNRAEGEISVIDRIINQRRQLASTEEESLRIEIEGADKRIKLLEDYGLKSTDLYDEAIFQKKVAEKNLTDFLAQESEKRLNKEEQDNEKRKQDALSTASEVLNIAGTLTNGITNLVNQRYQNEIQRAGDNQEAIEQIQKEQFETNKALGIVTAIINTAQGITNALATSGPPWVGIAMAAVVGALGAAEVAMIASQEFTPGTSGGSSFTPNAQLSQSMGSVNAMQPNVNFAAAGSGANIQTAGGGSAQSVQFTGSISVSEINNTQNLVNIYETGSLLGSG